MTLKLRAHAKINWALDITGRREDGYHELDMLMQNVDFADELTFTPARWITLSVNGRPAPSGSKNLILRAANALNELMGEKRGARITLTKRIPVRAGLGGGSADCAVTLMALNELWKLKLKPETLRGVGASLGADVPYCLTGGLCRVRGIGDIIDRVPGAPRARVLISPVGAGLSTQAVFARWDEGARAPLGVNIPAVLESVLAGDYKSAQYKGGNALEAPAISMLPLIQTTIDKLIASGAAFARMSGSGSAVYGVFDSETALARAKAALPGAIDTYTLPASPI